MKKSVTEFTPYRNRTLEEGEKVEVHYNLHEGGFSITSVKSGLVVARAPYVNLVDVRTRVRQSGRERVIKEQSKNVHAHIIGYFTSSNLDMINANRMTYDPYKYDSFVDKDTKEKVLEAKYVKCIGKSALYKLS